VLAGSLQEIPNIKPPSVHVRALGDAKNKALRNYEMNIYFCWENSPSIVEAMKEVGENDWRVVYGFAFGSGGRLYGHVWVSKGDQHFDATWSKYDRALDDCRYFSLTDKHASVDSFKALKELGAEWNLDFE
jgi:hypothetical protein